MDGWMLGKCCLFGVSDLFLTFPGVFFNFKKISTGSTTRNNFTIIVTRVLVLVVLVLLILVLALALPVVV